MRNWLDITIFNYVSLNKYIMSNTKKAVVSTATKEAPSLINGQVKKVPTRAEIEAQVTLQLARLEELQTLRQRREKFIEVQKSLEEVEVELEEETTGGEFDRSDYRLNIEGRGGKLFSISNAHILAAFVDFIKPRIESKISEINTELLK